MADTREIAEKFPAEEFLILRISGQSIFDKGYLREVEKLTERLSDLNAFHRILSLSRGPETVEEAANSPFWRPLLIDEQENASFLLAFLPRETPDGLIAAVEEITSAIETARSVDRIDISGMPFIAEHIKRSIVHDAQLFSLAGIVIFSVLIFWIYRSAIIVLGAAFSGVLAVVTGLVLQHFAGQPVGILTANLAIIIYVLVQSQVVYLTNNWISLSKKDGERAVFRALKMTSVPAFWCGVTTLLGFVSLLFVSAEPLRQLGVGGAIGVGVALLVALGIYPAFLMRAPIKTPRARVALNGKANGQLIKTGQFLVAIGMLAALVFAILGISRLETDPGLMAYFSKEGEIGRSLQEIDKNGGSSPLLLVVSRKTGDQLDAADSYEKLWKLHNQLAGEREVGTVLSLPALLAEANRHPLAFLIPWPQMVSLLQLEANQQVVDSFLTEDRQEALFLLRMKEELREGNRLDVISKIEEIASQNGFHADLTGGVYVLQARLSDLVASSLVSGLIALICIFAGIAALLTRQVGLSLAMVLAAGVMPLFLLGGTGVMSVPLDVISAPAISVSFGLAVDAIIHLAMAVVRSDNRLAVAERLKTALAEQGRGILVANGLLALGFMIFTLSEFPPTVRFGGMIVVGALIALPASTVLFPLLAELFSKQRNYRS
nr:MMPL family transporter [Sneathiella limimaris]